MKGKIESPSDRIEYRFLTLDDAEEAIELQMKSMFQEILAIGTGYTNQPIGTDREGFEILLKTLIADGFTMGAWDKKTNKLVGVCFTKLNKKSDRDLPDPIENIVTKYMKNPATRDIMNFVSEVEGAIDVFDHFNVDIALEIFYIAVDLRFQGHQVGWWLMRIGLDSIQERIANGEPDMPQVIYAVMTSSFSRATCKKFHMHWIHQARFENFVCHDGKKLSERIEAMVGKSQEYAAMGAALTSENLVY